MLLKHGVWYALARGIPGLITFLGITVYTRILSPEDYGQYAVVFATVQLIDALFFQWLRLAVLRFMTEYKDRRGTLLGVVAGAYLVVGIGVLVAGGLIAWVLPAGPSRMAVVIGVPLTLIYSWFEIGITVTRSDLRPARYGLLSVTKAGLGLVLGYVLVKWGLGAWGILGGLMLGTLLPGLLQIRTEWREAAAELRPNPVMVRQLLAYGLPLTGSYALGYLLRNGDRYLLNWLAGAGDAGLYAVGYDLAQQSIGILALTINLAAFPLVMKAFSDKGEEAARTQLRQSATTLLAVALPATVGLSMIAGNVAAVVVGGEFQAAAASLIPWVAWAALVTSIKSYHFDMAFHLGKDTIRQLWITGLCALINLVLNLWLIPHFGSIAAALATLVAYTVGLGLSWFLGRAVFAVPVPWGDIGRIGLSSLLMGLALLPMSAERGALALLYQIATGAGVYAIAFIGLNVGGIRLRLLPLLRRGRGVTQQ